MNKTPLATVYVSTNYKKGKKYRDYRIKIPNSVADDFCLTKKQKLFLEVEKVSREIILSVKPKDIKNHEEWNKRMMKEDGRRKKKTERRKIISNKKTRIHKWISYIKEINKEYRRRIRENREIIEIHKRNLKELDSQKIKRHLLFR